MRGVKAKELRRKAKDINGSETVDAIYDDKAIKDWSESFLRNVMVSRKLNRGCTRAIYQSLK